MWPRGTPRMLQQSKPPVCRARHRQVRLGLSSVFGEEAEAAVQAVRLGHPAAGGTGQASSNGTVLPRRGYSLPRHFSDTQNRRRDCGGLCADVAAERRSARCAARRRRAAAMGRNTRGARSWGSGRGDDEYPISNTQYPRVKYLRRTSSLGIPCWILDIRMPCITFAGALRACAAGHTGSGRSRSSCAASAMRWRPRPSA